MIKLDLAENAFQPDSALQNLSSALNAEAFPAAYEMLSVLSQHGGVGLWDAQLHHADPMHSRSVWRWSAEFRRLLGFQTATEFPDTVFSWSDRLHPDDADETFTALYKCLADLSGQTKFDVAFRLKAKDDSYRLFRAICGVVRDTSGKALRACGTLIDINETGVAEAEHRFHLEKLADAFRAGVAEAAHAVAASAATLESAARHIAEGVERAHSHMRATQEHSTGIRSGLEQTASEANDLCAFESGVADQFSELLRVTSLASDDAGRTNEALQKLAGATTRVNDAVKLIATIAGQSNLLALNASIEAARAGDAGNAFARVAIEFKQLANQIAAANEEIAVKVASVRDEAARTSDAVQQLSFAVDHAGRFSQIIASTTEQQHAAMRQIRDSLAQSVSQLQPLTRDFPAGSESAATLLASVDQLNGHALQLGSESAVFFDALAPE